MSADFVPWGRRPLFPALVTRAVSCQDSQRADDKQS